MRKYFLIFLGFIVITFCISIVQQQLAIAAGKQGDVCTGSGHGTCGGDLFCTPPDWNNPAIESTCVKTHMQSSVCKSHCTLAGPQQDCKKNSDCGNGLICAVKNENMCSLYGAKNPHACDSWCILKPTPTLVPQGGKCTQKGQCKPGLTCTKGKCLPIGNVCTIGSSCPPGTTCVGLGTPQECAHLGVGCTGTCQVATTGKDPTEIPPPPSPPCKQWTKQGVCSTVGSTFGGFSTDPQGFIQKIFAVLLSVSGGIALLLIIKAGYQLMTAQGNPEKLNNGREQLVAAIVGLVFLIFSFVFLQLIGFDILHIPGFGK